MLAIDLKNAFDPGRQWIDNFTVILLRLIAKADSENRERLRKVFPVAVKAVEIYKGDCSYEDAERSKVDWIKIAERAEAETPGATGNFPEGKISEEDEGELKIAIGVDSVKQQVVVNFGKPVAWFGMPAVSANGLGTMLIAKAEELASQ